MRARGRLVPALFVLASCSVGGNQNPASSPAATSPHGVTVRIDWRESDDSFWGDEAELLAIADSGLYLLHGRYVVLYPFGTDAVLRPRQAPGASSFNLEDPDPQDLEALELYARYAFGLDAAGLERLLGALDRDSVIVRRNP